MNGPAVAPEVDVLLAVLAALALLLLVIAARIGRWPVWLLGYALLAIALALAFVSRSPGGTS